MLNVVSGKRDCSLPVVTEGDCNGFFALGFGCLRKDGHHATELTTGWRLVEMDAVFVLDGFELLHVTDAVVVVGGSHSLVDALLFGAESVAYFGEGGGADCVVDVADVTVGILSDLITLGGELAAESVHSFFKFVHCLVKFWR